MAQQAEMKPQPSGVRIRVATTNVKDTFKPQHIRFKERDNQFLKSSKRVSRPSKLSLNITGNTNRISQQT